MTKHPENTRIKSIEKIIDAFNGPYTFDYTAGSANVSCTICHQILLYNYSSYEHFYQHCLEHYEKHQEQQIKNAINNNAPVIVVNKFIDSNQLEIPAKVPRLTNLANLGLSQAVSTTRTKEKLSASLERTLSQAYTLDNGHYRCNLCSALIVNKFTELLLHIENHESLDEDFEVFDQSNTSETSINSQSSMPTNHSSIENCITKRGSLFHCALCHIEFASKRQHLSTVRHKKTEEISLEYNAIERDNKAFLADIAKLSLDLNLSVAKHKFLKPFLEKYTGRHVPSANTIRKYVNVLKNTSVEGNTIHNVDNTNDMETVQNTVQSNQIEDENHEKPSRIDPESQESIESDDTIYLDSGSEILDHHSEQQSQLNRHSHILTNSLDGTDGLQIIQITALDPDSVVDGGSIDLEHNLHEIIVTTEDNEQVSLESVLMNSTQQFEGHTDFAIYDG